MKQRIVGSLILLSLAVIILPFWLDGAGLEEYQLTQQQPAMPAMSGGSINTSLSSVTEQENIALSDLKVIELSPVPVLTTKKQPVAAKSNAQAAEKTPPRANNSLLNQQGLPNGWAVQLGNFGNRTNAVRLKDKVIKAGFAAYMVPNGNLFKVLVGPELNRPKAEALQKKLTNKFKMPGMVVLYQVEKL